MRRIDPAHGDAAAELIGQQRHELQAERSCIGEVDLLGQVNTETAGGRYVGALGGAVDFLRAAARSPGGHSVVALPAATSRGRPRIVDRVENAKKSD